MSATESKLKSIWKIALTSICLFGVFGVLLPLIVRSTFRVFCNEWTSNAMEFTACGAAFYLFLTANGRKDLRRIAEAIALLATANILIIKWLEKPLGCDPQKNDFEMPQAIPVSASLVLFIVALLVIAYFAYRQWPVEKTETAKEDSKSELPIKDAHD